MKRLFAAILSALLVLSMTAVAFAAVGAPAAAGEDTKIYFDAASSGWQGFDLIAFHFWAIDDPDFVAVDWGSKRQNGTNEGGGLWSYDTTKVGTIKPGCQYAVIIYAKINGSASQQTYNLLFGAPCLGLTAATDGVTYENPEDSNKITQAAFWGGGIDPSVYGPQLMVTSIGNVVGTCCPASTTPYGLFVFFLTDRLANARAFTDKTDQELLDDTAAALGLEREDVVTALEQTEIAVDWDADASPLPRHEPVPGEDEKVPYTVDVVFGEGTAVGDKDILTINYSLPPEYAYDTVTLTATPAEGYSFEGWTIEGSYEIEGDADLYSAVLTVKAFEGIKAHARFYINEPVVPGEHQRGDADGDGSVTIMDATRIQRWLADLEPDDRIDNTAADADGDGEVTIMDATRIQRYLAELCDMDGKPISAPDPYELQTVQ